MSFVRPEVQAKLRQWRQALIGLGVFSLALWGALTTFGVTRWVFAIGVVAGLLLIWEGIRRARFPAAQGGLGVVEVDERQISYLSPVGGGTISIEDLIQIEISTTDFGSFLPQLFWTFKDSAGKHLTIPGNAEGTSTLFDALTALPGVDYDAITNASAQPKQAQIIVWQKPASASGNVEILPPRS